METSVIIGGGLLIDSTVVSTAGYRAFVPFVLITPNHELWIKIKNIKNIFQFCAFAPCMGWRRMLTRLLIHCIRLISLRDKVVTAWIQGTKKQSGALALALHGTGTGTGTD